jgi:hypothetical protein
MLLPVQGRISPDLEAVEGAFLHCTDCSVVHRVTPSDRAAVYLDDGTARAADDFHRFLSTHLDHRFRLLHRSSDAEMLSHARWDPMCRVAWEATDGEHDFVVTFGRSDLEGPRQYMIFPGHLLLESETVEVDGDVLRQAIDEALFPHAAPFAKIGAVVDVCRRLVAAVPTDELEPVDELRDDPATQLACLPPAVADALRAEVLKEFAGSEGPQVAELFDHDLRSDIPLIRLTRRYRIETFA